MKATVVGSLRQAKELGPGLAAMAKRLGPVIGRPKAAFSVLLTDDAGIQDYNRRFRQLDEPTDVLSFPAGAGDPSDDGHYLGDLVVSVETAARQAADHGHGLAAECEILVLHGVLHLLGHDHETDDGEMRALEARLAGQVLGDVRGLIQRVEEGGRPRNRGPRA